MTEIEYAAPTDTAYWVLYSAAQGCYLSWQDGQVAAWSGTMAATRFPNYTSAVAFYPDVQARFEAYPVQMVATTYALRATIKHNGRHFRGLWLSRVTEDATYWWRCPDAPPVPAWRAWQESVEDSHILQLANRETAVQTRHRIQDLPAVCPRLIKSGIMRHAEIIELAGGTKMLVHPRDILGAQPEPLPARESRVVILRDESLNT